MSLNIAYSFVVFDMKKIIWEKLEADYFSETILVYNLKPAFGYEVQKACVIEGFHLSEVIELCFAQLNKYLKTLPLFLGSRMKILYTPKVLITYSLILFQ